MSPSYHHAISPLSLELSPSSLPSSPHPHHGCLSPSYHNQLIMVSLLWLYLSNHCHQHHNHPYCPKPVLCARHSVSGEFCWFTEVRWLLVSNCHQHHHHLYHPEPFLCARHSVSGEFCWFTEVRGLPAPVILRCGGGTQTGFVICTERLREVGVHTQRLPNAIPGSWALCPHGGPDECVTTAKAHPQVSSHLTLIITYEVSLKPETSTLLLCYILRLLDILSQTKENSVLYEN